MVAGSVYSEATIYEYYLLGYFQCCATYIKIVAQSLPCDPVRVFLTVSKRGI